MPEMHIAAEAHRRIRRGDLIQIRVPVAVAEGDELVLHVTTVAEPVDHVAEGRYLGLHDPRTGLRH